MRSRRGGVLRCQRHDSAPGCSLDPAVATPVDVYRWDGDNLHLAKRIATETGETTLPGGLRLAWDTQETVRSFLPDWQPATGGSDFRQLGSCSLCGHTCPIATSR